MVIPFFVFLFGLIFGSFLNVCISRIPEGLSVVSPGSRCPRCLTPIKPYDNIPVLGWLWLRGKCRNCGLPISPMYPVVEFVTGLLFVLVFREFGLTLAALKWMVFSCLMVVLVVTDLRVRILPDLVNFPGMAAGLLFSLGTPVLDTTATTLYLLTFRRIPFSLPWIVFSLLNAVLGAILGSFLLWGAAKVYQLVRKKEGMGMGDVKMMAMVGTFLGPRGAFLTILFGTLLGSITGLGWIGLLYMAGWKRKVAERAARRGLGSTASIRWALAAQYQLPLGTFLGVAALGVVYGFPWLDSILPR